MIPPRNLARLLHLLAECVANSSEEAIQDLLDGRARLLISSSIRAPAPDKRRKLSPRGVEKTNRALREVGSIAERLVTLETRNEGQELLADSALARRDLERLARFLELPVRKDDSIERLRDRIVEATIGARLVSRAIRG